MGANRPRNGRKLPRFKNSTVFSVRAHNDVIDAINPLFNIIVVEGQYNQAIISDENLTIMVKKSSGSEGGSGMHWEFEYNNGTDYTQWAVVRVPPANAWSTVTLGEDDGSRPGVYIAIQAVPAGSAVPRSPIQTGGENDFWQLVSEWPQDCPLG